MEKEIYILGKKLVDKPVENSVRSNILKEIDSEQYYELYCKGTEKDRFDHIVKNFRGKIENMVILTVLVTVGERGDVYEIKKVEDFSSEFDFS